MATRLLGAKLNLLSVHLPDGRHLCCQHYRAVVVFPRGCGEREARGEVRAGTARPIK